MERERETEWREGGEGYERGRDRKKKYILTGTVGISQNNPRGNVNKTKQYKLKIKRLCYTHFCKIVKKYCHKERH